MTRDEWLARCANAYDMGFVTFEGGAVLRSLERAADVTNRLIYAAVVEQERAESGDQESNPTSPLAREPTHQALIAIRTVSGLAEAEIARARRIRSTPATAQPHSTVGVLSGADVGYRAVQLAALLSYPCQICAVDPNGWHTRRCSHM